MNMDQTFTIEQVSTKLNLVPRSVHIVLDILAAHNLLSKTSKSLLTNADDNFTYQASEYLKKLAKAFGNPAAFVSNIMMFSNVEGFLRTGSIVMPNNASGSNEEREKNYEKVVLMLATLFFESAKALAKILPPVKEILDVGAGSGVWSLAQVQTYGYDFAHTTALDFPLVLGSFKSFASRIQVPESCISTIAGSYHEVEVPKDKFDRIILANIVHLEDEAQAASLIHRFAQFMKPGSELVIVDMMGSTTDPNSKIERIRANYSLHLALRSTKGWGYPLALLKAWMEQAGLKPDPEPIMIEGSQNAQALVARK